MFSSDLFKAQDWLGEYYNLTPKTKLEKQRKVVKLYQYKDPDTGVIIHETVRYEPKQFKQRRPDPSDPEKHIYDLKGITPILYRIVDWRASKWVCVVGGEKDVDKLMAIGVPATTNPMGEGNWRKDYAPYFQGKNVVLIPDNDETGRTHVNTVALAIRAVAHAIKIVTLPDLPEHGDSSDWIATGGTRDQFLALVKSTPAVDTQTLKAVSPAKAANTKPLANFRWGQKVSGAGKAAPGMIPVHINELVDEIFIRFKGFPRRVGSVMFDHDEKTDQIRPLKTPDDLFAWIEEKSGQRIDWSTKLQGAVTRGMLYSSLYARCQEYQMISSVPTWPARNDVYYTFGELPEPTPDARYFSEFCEFFNPTTGEDMELLRVLVASPIYYIRKADRPLWVIDSEHGQGVGKTKLAEMIAMLYGGDDIESGEPLWADYKLVNNESSLYQLFRRLLSTNGRRKRIFLLDNVDGYFKSSALATLITQGSISGMAPYGKTEETRTNDLTYIITSNSATVSRDLSSRAMFISMSRPECPRDMWEKEVQEFITTNRMQIMADIIGILEKGAQFDFSPATRFRTWERDVMAPVMATSAVYNLCWKVNQERQITSDGEIDEADQIKDYFRNEIERCGLNPDTCALWIEARAIQLWSVSAVPGLGGQDGRNSRHKILNMIKGGMLPEMSAPVRRYPQKNGKSGLAWGWERRKEAIKSNQFAVIAYDSNKSQIVLK